MCIRRNHVFQEYAREHTDHHLQHHQAQCKHSPLFLLPELRILWYSFTPNFEPKERVMAGTRRWKSDVKRVLDAMHGQHIIWQNTKANKSDFDFASRTCIRASNFLALTWSINAFHVWGADNLLTTCMQPDELHTLLCRLTWLEAAAIPNLVFGLTCLFITLRFKHCTFWNIYVVMHKISLQEQIRRNDTRSSSTKENNTEVVFVPCLSSLCGSFCACNLERAMESGEHKSEPIGWTQQNSFSKHGKFSQCTSASKSPMVADTKLHICQLRFESLACWDLCMQ